MKAGDRIYVAGHTGLVGSALCRQLKQAGCDEPIVRKSGNLDLRNQDAINSFFKTEKPQYVFLAAATVGGILANHTRRAEFIYDNLMIAANVLHAAAQLPDAKVLFLGSSCIYPKFAVQPIQEESLLTGPLEETNQPYALAKIAGIELCKAYRAQYGCHFISVMPTNLYGPNDNFDPDSSHVLPGLMYKMHEAARTRAPFVEVWGTGAPRREFLHADDLAAACVFLMNTYDAPDVLNIGTGEDISIHDLAHLMAKTVGYDGEIRFNPDKPDGTPRKLLDVSKIHALGWRHKISLEEGIRTVYAEAFPQ